MEEFLDEWNDYAFTGHFLGRCAESDDDFEYAVYVFSSGGYLFALHLRATRDYLELQGIDLNASRYRTAGLLQAHAIDHVKQRLRSGDYRPLEVYEERLILEPQV